MSEIFLKIINMSISAGWIVLAVLLLRLLFKKAPKWISVLLWGIVAVRLICPFSIESPFSLVPDTNPINTDIFTDPINTGTSIENALEYNTDAAINESEIVNGTVIAPETGTEIEAATIIDEPTVTPAPTKSADTTKSLFSILSKIWIFGMMLLLAYTVISYWRVKRKVGTAILLRDNIYQSENVIFPFVLGIIKPKIYLPFNVKEQDTGHIIAHEQAHIKRKDHWWKPLGFLLLAIHWFNPLLWLSYVLLCRDIELACDEKVVRELNNEQRTDYSQALLTSSINRRMVAACPLAFGAVGVKTRVKSVLNYKKPAFWAIAVAVTASIVLAVCFLTNPVYSKKLKNIENLSLDKIAKMTASVMVSNGIDFIPAGAINEDVLKDLVNLKISSNQISNDRSIYRDMTHTLLLQDAKEANAIIYEYLSGTYIHFNSDFTSVWVKIGDKPTLSYSIIDPTEAENIYKRICAYTGDYNNSFNIDNFYYSLEAEAEKDYTDIYWIDHYNVPIIYSKSRYYVDDFTHIMNIDDINKTNKVYTSIRFSNLEEKFPMYHELKSELEKTDYGLSSFSYSKYGYFDYGYSDYDLSDYDLSDYTFSVYIWQTEKGALACGLLPGKEKLHTMDELLKLKPASITEMRIIIREYLSIGLAPGNVAIHAIQKPFASYTYKIDDEYRKNLSDLFWYGIFPMNSVEPRFYSISNEQFDIDGDGIDEECSLGIDYFNHNEIFYPCSTGRYIDIESYGSSFYYDISHSSNVLIGKFTFTLSAYENGVLEYYNTFSSPYLNMSLGSDENKEKLFIHASDGQRAYNIAVSLVDKNFVVKSDYFDISYYGEQGKDCSTSPYNRWVSRDDKK